MIRRVLKWAAVAAVLVGVWWTSSLPGVGVLVGWSLLVYVIVRAVPAIRRDVSRLIGGRLAGVLPDRPAHSANEWRF